jgi:hypothetical protein
MKISQAELLFQLRDGHVGGLAALVKLVSHVCLFVCLLCVAGNKPVCALKSVGYPLAMIQDSPLSPLQRLQGTRRHSSGLPSIKFRSSGVGKVWVGGRQQPPAPCHLPGGLLAYRERHPTSTGPATKRNAMIIEPNLTRITDRKCYEQGDAHKARPLRRPLVCCLLVLC